MAALVRVLKSVSSVNQSAEFGLVKTILSRVNVAGVRVTAKHLSCTPYRCDHAGDWQDKANNPDYIDLTLLKCKYKKRRTDLEFARKTVDFVKREYPNHTKIYTDASIKTPKAGIGIYCKEFSSVDGAYRVKNNTVPLLAELLAIHVAMGKIEELNATRKNGYHNYMILTDNSHSIRLLDRRPLPSDDNRHTQFVLEKCNNLVGRIMQKAISLRKRGVGVMFSWVPGHVGILGSGDAKRSAYWADHGVMKGEVKVQSDSDFIKSGSDPHVPQCNFDVDKTIQNIYEEHKDKEWWGLEEILALFDERGPFYYRNYISVFVDSNASHLRGWTGFGVESELLRIHESRISHHSGFAPHIEAAVAILVGLQEVLKRMQTTAEKGEIRARIGKKPKEPFKLFVMSPEQVAIDYLLDHNNERKDVAKQIASAIFSLSHSKVSVVFSSIPHPMDVPGNTKADEYAQTATTQENPVESLLEFC